MPAPDLSEPDDLVQRALSVITSDRLPYLATVEGDQPRLRPISPAKTDGFVVYVPNLRSHGKTAEIEVNPRVELCYLDGHNDQVRISGLAEVVADPALKAEVWNSNPQLRHHFATADSPDFILYRIVPTRVRYMKEWALTYHEVPFERMSKST
jgi:general stress protein 26